MVMPPMQPKDFSALCGALPSRETTTNAYRVGAPFRPAAVSELPADGLAPRALELRLRGQGGPYCVGEGCGGECERQCPPHDPSGASIWREAHRQQGMIEEIDRGTRIEYGIAAIEGRGYSDPWRQGEDSDTEEWGLNATAAGDDLADELSAYATAHHTIDHATIWGFGADLHRQLQLAIAGGQGIICATGLRSQFFSLGPDEVATLEHIGGEANGHCMLIVGWRLASNGKPEFLLRNSWNTWGGATVNGRFYPGLFWCSAEAVNTFWEFHLLRVVQ